MPGYPCCGGTCEEYKTQFGYTPPLTVEIDVSNVTDYTNVYPCNECDPDVNVIFLADFVTDGSFVSAGCTGSQIGPSCL